jgi:hypothetical protein
MPPAVTRELSITYAGVTIGGSSATHLLTGKYRLVQDYTSSTLEFRVLVVGSSAATLKTNCDTLETAFRTPLAAATVILDGSTLTSFSHSSSTGFNAVPSITKVAGDGDNARSREYDCSLVVGRPADLTGYNGRRWQDTKIVVSTEANNHTTIEISGVYTAIGATGATAQYAASIGAYCAAIQLSVSPTSTWDKTHEVTTVDDTDKVLAFSRTYEAVSSAGSGGGSTEPPDLEKWSVTITRTYIGPGDAFDSSEVAERLIAYNISITGLASSTSLSTIMHDWRTTRTWAIAKMRALYSPGTLALTDESMTPDLKSGSIKGNLSFIGTAGSGKLLEWNITYSAAPDSGYSIVPVWDTPYSVHVFQGPRTSTRSVVQTERRLFDSTKAYLNAPPESLGMPSTGLKWHRITPVQISEVPLLIGTGDFTFKVIERQTSWTERWMDVISVAGGDGSVGAVPIGSASSGSGGSVTSGSGGSTSTAPVF